METIGLRELRQNASEVIRRVEAGQIVTVTVNGRPTAELAPLPGRRWRTWDQVRDVLSGAGAPELGQDLAVIDHSIADPFDDAR